MPAVTILGRGDDWTECYKVDGELWGTSTCLLTPILRDKPYTKIFAFDGLNFPEIAKALAIATDRNIPIVSTLDYATEKFPLRDVAREFLSSFFKPTISYMLAYAIYLKYEKFIVHGIGGRKRWDYEQNKPYIIFWLGVATGKRIDWRLGKGSQRWLYDFSLPYGKESAEERANWHES